MNDNGWPITLQVFKYIQITPYSMSVICKSVHSDQDAHESSHRFPNSRSIVFIELIRKLHSKSPVCFQMRYCTMAAWNNEYGQYGECISYRVLPMRSLNDSSAKAMQRSETSSMHCKIWALSSIVLPSLLFSLNSYRIKSALFKVNFGSSAA